MFETLALAALSALIGLTIVSFVSCGLYYLFGYAKITAWMRPSLPMIVQVMLTCSACSGFWLGGFTSLGLVFLVGHHGLLPLQVALLLAAALIGGLWTMTTTPILFRLLLDSLKALAQDLAEHASEEINGEEDTLRG